MCARSAARFVKILFDLYHVQIMEGNLIETLRANIAAIGHFPCRRCALAGTNPALERFIMAMFSKPFIETGYRDFVAMEYVPSKDAMTTLAEVRALAASSQSK